MSLRTALFDQALCVSKLAAGLGLCCSKHVESLHPHLKEEVQSTLCSFVWVGWKFGAFSTEAMVSFKPRAQPAAVREESWVEELG